MTFNEEENIGRCLDAVKDIADEILVVDSFSTDRTLEIAGSFGARIIKHPFESHRAQREYLIAQTKHDWLLVLDADEHPDQVQLNAIKQQKSAPDLTDVFLCNRLSGIGNHFLYHGGWHPDWKARFFKKGKVTIGGEMPHETIDPVPGATIKKLPGKLLHFSDKDLRDRFETINTHSSTAAKFMFKNGKKTNLFRILAKPPARFLADYIFKKGFLDGYMGFVVACSTGWYVFMREVKLREMWGNGEL